MERQIVSQEVILQAGKSYYTGYTMYYPIFSLDLDTFMYIVLKKDEYLRNVIEPVLQVVRDIPWNHWDMPIQLELTTHYIGPSENCYSLYHKSQEFLKMEERIPIREPDFPYDNLLLYMIQDMIGKKVVNEYKAYFKEYTEHIQQNSVVRDALNESLAAFKTFGNIYRYMTKPAIQTVSDFEEVCEQMLTKFLDSFTEHQGLKMSVDFLNMPNSQSLFLFTEKGLFLYLRYVDRLKKVANHWFPTDTVSIKCRKHFLY